MRTARAHSDWIDDPITLAQPQPDPAPPTAAPLMAEPASAARPASAEDELRDYMQKMNLNRYGHAAALLNQLDGRNR